MVAATASASALVRLSDQHIQTAPSDQNHVIGNQPDGLNINDGFGATKPRALASSVRVNSADLGIALDGDGDRVIMVDGDGEIVDGDEILYVIARSRLNNGGLQGGVDGIEGQVEKERFLALSMPL